MNGFLDHILINVTNPKISFSFYKDFLKYLGYTIIADESDYIAARKGGTADLWIVQTDPKYAKGKFHRKNTGLNHLAFRVSSRGGVDRFCNEFLKPRNIPTLYFSPKEFPEYTKNYYAVFFEDPDRIKLEIMVR